MGKKKQSKKKYKKRERLELDERVYFLVAQLGQGNTLEEVAAIQDIPFTQLISEIAEEPRLKQAVIDGKALGKAYWQSKLKKYMIRPNINSSLVKLWFANYMNWWDRPLPEEFDENSSVSITVVQHVPGKKQQKLIDEAENNVG